MKRSVFRAVALCLATLPFFASGSGSGSPVEEPPSASTLGPAAAVTRAEHPASQTATNDLGFPSFFPPFSWRTVPVYQMFGANALLTDAQLNQIASTSDFICIEKAHGRTALGASDLGARHEIARFQALDHSMKCLVYFNSAYAYPFTSYSQAFHPSAIHQPQYAPFKSFLLVDPATGDLAHRRNVYFFDVLNPELRAWWARAVGDFVRAAGSDGLFVDQMHGFVWLRPEQKAEVQAAQAELMRRAKTTIGAQKILLLNNAAHIPALFEIGDAFMFEHYNEASLSKQQILDDWALMKQIAQAKKIAVWRIGVEVEGGTLNAAALEERSRRQIAFYLAAFLAGAQEYSYFQYGWGWGLDTGPLVAYPELKHPLGKPAGDLTRIDPTGWVFQRDFEHARVTVDLERRAGSIDWKTPNRE